MTLYKVIRNKVCTTGTMFCEYSYQDINMAYQICAQYNNCFCYSGCGCQFKVEENADTSLWSNTFTTTLPITYIPQYISSTPIWITSTGTNTGGWTATSATTNTIANTNVNGLTYTFTYT